MFLDFYVVSLLETPTCKCKKLLEFRTRCNYALNVIIIRSCHRLSEGQHRHLHAARVINSYALLTSHYPRFY